MGKDMDMRDNITCICISIGRKTIYPGTQDSPNSPNLFLLSRHN